MSIKNTVITGASKGIGKAIAESLARQKNNVFLCSRNPAEASEVAQSLKAIHPEGTFKAMACDVTIKADLEHFAQACLETFDGKIDVLVNNAGLFEPGEASTEADGQMERMMETNLYSAYHLSRMLLPAMKQRRKGHIINMCSIASLAAYPNGGSYTISKFALLGFSKVLREEMKPFGIKVTSIMPGATWSDSWKGADFPEDRLMSPEDVASVVSCALQLSDSATMEDVVIRPQLGDL